jgi:transposase-like protein
LSYRDVEDLLAERGLHADHVTVWRWVQRYAPEMERRLRSRLRPTNDSWRVDETYIRVKGKWVYLYRAGVLRKREACLRPEASDSAIMMATTEPPWLG